MIHYTHIYNGPVDFNVFAASLDIKPDDNVLIQVFTGIVSREHIREIQTLVSAALPDAAMIGCTTAGEICGDRIAVNSTVISISIFERTKVSTAIMSGDDYHDIGMKLARQVCGTDTVVALCLSSGIDSGVMLSGQEFCDGFNVGAPGIPIAGGLCGDNAAFKQGYLFDREQIIGNGAVVASLNGRFLRATSCYNFGWRPLGREFTITAAKNSTIFSLDDIPAADVFERYFGIYAGNGFTQGFVFPLYTERNGMRVARSIRAVNSDRSLDITGVLDCGDKVSFSYGGAHNLLESCLRLQHKWQDVEADAVYMYSCACRKWNLPQVTADEVKLLYNGIPTAGFFSYGEYFYTGVNCEFMNFTQTLLAIKEETIAVNGKFTVLHEFDLSSEPIRLIAINVENQQQNLQVLDQLVAAMSSEMMTLNRKLEAKNAELQSSLEHIKTMQGLLPICASCKKIRDDQGYWHHVESYIRDHTEAVCSHGVCPDCLKKLYPNIDPDKIFKDN